MAKDKRVYVVRKYIVATSAKDAILKDKSTPVHDCWLEENSQKEMVNEISVKQRERIGF